MNEVKFVDDGNPIAVPNTGCSEVVMQNKELRDLIRAKLAFYTGLTMTLSNCKGEDFYDNKVKGELLKYVESSGIEAIMDTINNVIKVVSAPKKPFKSPRLDGDEELDQILLTGKVKDHVFINAKDVTPEEIEAIRLERNKIIKSAKREGFTLDKKNCMANELDGYGIDEQDLAEFKNSISKIAKTSQKRDRSKKQGKNKR